MGGSLISQELQVPDGLDPLDLNIAFTPSPFQNSVVSAFNNLTSIAFNSDFISGNSTSFMVVFICKTRATVSGHLFQMHTDLFIYLFSFIFISWRLITLQYCSGFCHTLTWISHGFTCVPHPDPPSHLPPHPIPLGLPSHMHADLKLSPGKGVYYSIPTKPATVSVI